MTTRLRDMGMGFAALLATASAVAQVSTGSDAGVASTASSATPAPTAVAAPPAPIPFEDGGTLSGEQYVVRLRDLEQRINELKEEIFRSKARLSLLAESVLGNVVGGSRAQIVHQNEMSGTFRLVHVVYSLDGAPILTRDDDASLSDQQEFRVYSGQVGAGDHSLGVNLEYLGAGLPYMKGYRFRVRSTQSFSVPEGKAIQIRVVGYERGGPLEPPENRPAIRYIQRVVSIRDLEDAEGEAASTNNDQQTSAQSASAPGSSNP